MGLALLSVAAALWMFAAAPAPVRRLPSTTHKFVCYFSELERTRKDLSLWDRLTISLVLAGAESGEQAEGRPLS
ncbi:MAG: hypothetical protein WHT08_10815 [Bryobacteraceae bacterium]|jgi:hypothetical protein